MDQEDAYSVNQTSANQGPDLRFVIEVNIKTL